MRDCADWAQIAEKGGRVYVNRERQCSVCGEPSQTTKGTAWGDGDGEREREEKARAAETPSVTCVCFRPNEKELPAGLPKDEDLWRAICSAFARLA